MAKFASIHHDFDKKGPIMTHKLQMGVFLKYAASKFMQETAISLLAPVHTPYPRGTFPAKGEEAEGQLRKTCSSKLVKLLFAARRARPDLTVTITRLARKVTLCSS